MCKARVRCALADRVCRSLSKPSRCTSSVTIRDYRPRGSCPSVAVCRHRLQEIQAVRRSLPRHDARSRQESSACTDRKTGWRGSWRSSLNATGRSIDAVTLASWPTETNLCGSSISAANRVSRDVADGTAWPLSGQRHVHRRRRRAHGLAPDGTELLIQVRTNRVEQPHVRDSGPRDVQSLGAENRVAMASREFVAQEPAAHVQHRGHLRRASVAPDNENAGSFELSRRHIGE
jgi:hypothetical protein